MRLHTKKKKAGVSLAEGCCVTPQPVADAALLANPRGMVLLKSAVLFFFLPNASAVYLCDDTTSMCVCHHTTSTYVQEGSAVERAVPGRAVLLKRLCLALPHIHRLVA